MTSLLVWLLIAALTKVSDISSIRTCRNIEPPCSILCFEYFVFSFGKINVRTLLPQHRYNFFVFLVRHKTVTH